ncbi:Phenolic acid decarboxylase OS=Streptomyces fumanus OX=67302 GN=GCM10018772_17980 PE=3 SV=1 [Streptomyces fumanus]
MVELAPASQPAGVTSKMIIDATTPVGPDVRGNFGTPVKDLPETAEWAAKLRTLLAGR